jgi:hypothetical protein
MLSNCYIKHFYYINTATQGDLLSSKKSHVIFTGEKFLPIIAAFICRKGMSIRSVNFRQDLKD